MSLSAKSPGAPKAAMLKKPQGIDEIVSPVRD